MADEQPLTANRSYDLICQSTGSRPQPALTWWKDGVRIENDPKSSSVSISLFPKIFAIRRHKTI